MSAKAVWEASKESGPALKSNLVTLRDLRNGWPKKMKYPDYFSLEVAAYGMTTDEMLKMLEDWMATLRPLYLQTAHVGEIQAGREIPSTGAEENPSSLDQQSLEPGMARFGRSR